MALQSTDVVDNPYPGLRAFRRDETHIFFGREDAVADMVDRMATHRFLAVTGYSGSGKSSLVRVGLLDALDRGMLVDAGSNWAIADFAPGGQPFARLTAALMKAVDGDMPDDEARLVEAKLQRGPKGLVSWLDEIDFPQDRNLLLLVDQFEEIFRYQQGRIGDDVSAFVQLLLASAQQREHAVYVIITMRSDFLGDCARFSGLAEQINDSQFLTPRLTRDQCREAIEGPAGVYDGLVQAELVTRMLNDMAGNPDQLPLMQHVLMLLWEEACRRSASGPVTLTLADYERIGGIGPAVETADAAAVGAKNGALSDHADRVLASLSAPQQRTAAHLFKALTESQGSNHRAVRRPLRLESAAAICDASLADLIPVVDAFRAPGVHFLLPGQPTPLKPETIVDITHESLIRQWGKLREWVADEHQSAETYRSIERGAKQWKAGRGNLLSRLDLAVARKWLRSERPNVDWAQRYGDTFDLAMRYLRRSTARRRWRRFFSVTAMTAVPVVLLGSAVFMVAMLKTGLPYINPADEWSSFGVEPRSELRSDPGADTPRAIPGGRVIGTAELELAIKRGTLDGSPFLPIDVAYRSKDANVTAEIGQHYYIAGAGEAGGFADKTQEMLKAKLAELTQGDLSMPLVFFCTGARCWLSYNASLRAIHLGYRRVYWYRGGLNAWRAVQRPLQVDLRQIPMEPRDLLQSGASLLSMLKQELWPSADYDFLTGEDYLGRQQIDKAVDAFTRALAHHPDDIVYREHRGRAYEQKGEYAKATADYDAVLRQAPGNAALLERRGVVHYRNANYEGAIADFGGALAINRDNATLKANLAESHRARGYGLAKQEPVKALADFEAAIKLQRTDPLVFINRSDIWLAQGNRAKAVEDLTSAIAIAAKDRMAQTAYNSRAKIYEAMGDYVRATDDYSKAIEINPNDVSYVAARALASFYRADFARAIADFSSARQLATADYSNRAYVILFLYLSRVRAAPGGSALLELNEDARRLDLRGAWPSPVFELLLGRMSPDDLMKAATTQDQRCEASFYIGEWHLLRGVRDAGLTALRNAAATCSKNFWEYTAAILDIKRLAGP